VSDVIVQTRVQTPDRHSRSLAARSHCHTPQDPFSIFPPPFLKRLSPLLLSLSRTSPQAHYSPSSSHLIPVPGTPPSQILHQISPRRAENESFQRSEVRGTIIGDEFGDSGAAGAAEASGRLCGSALLAFVGLEPGAGDDEE
jgi:hypothetical protein